MNETPFCEMKLRPWIILLVLFAAGALAYSFWSALATGRLRMSGYHLSLGNPAAGPPPEHEPRGGSPGGSRVCRRRFLYFRPLWPRLSRLRSRWLALRSNRWR